MLIRALPADSALADSDGWTVEHELLAQLVEEVSVLAADRRRRQPRRVPRPGEPARTRPGHQTGVYTTPEGGTEYRGHLAIAAAFAAGGRATVSRNAS